MEEVNAKIPVAMQALLKVMLPRQDLWSCSPSETRTQQEERQYPYELAVVAMALTVIAKPSTLR